MFNYQIYNDNISLNIIEDNLELISKNQRAERLFKLIDMVIDSLLNYFKIKKIHPSIKDDFDYIIKNFNQLVEFFHEVNLVVM